MLANNLSISWRGVSPLISEHQEEIIDQTGITAFSRSVHPMSVSRKSRKTFGGPKSSIQLKPEERVLGNKQVNFCCVSWHFHHVICKTFKTLILNVNNNSFRSPIIAGNGPQTPRSKIKNQERDQFQGIWILEIKLSLLNNLWILREIPFAKSLANLNSLNFLSW